MSMPTPPTGDRIFRNEIIRITELAIHADVLEGLEFSDCRVIGPAILAPLDHVDFMHCRWGAPDLDALFWEISPERQLVVGVIGLRHCTFSRCSFEQIGVAGPSGLREQLAEGMSAD